MKCYLLKIADTSSKAPSRKRRNLKTFATSKITVNKQKKEIKDQKTFISCFASIIKAVGQCGTVCFTVEVKASG
jgi:hypothetical protein